MTHKGTQDLFIALRIRRAAAAVSGFRKLSDKMIRKLFSREGETVEETKERLSRK